MLQLEPLERRTVVGECHLVLGATIEELEHAFRKSLFRDLAQVEDVVAVVQAAHSRFPLSPNDDSGIPSVNTERIYPRETFFSSVSFISSHKHGEATLSTSCQVVSRCSKVSHSHTFSASRATTRQPLSACRLGYLDFGIRVQY